MRKEVWAPARVLLLLLAFAALQSCGGASQGITALHSRPKQQPAGFSLPAPSSLAAALQPLPRSASFEMEDLVVAGEDFSAELPFNRVSAGPDAATFSPNWFPGTPGIDGLAYAIYSFSIPNFSGSEKLSYFWKNAPTNPERAFIALANFDTDT